MYIMVDNKAEQIITFDQTNSTLEICGDPYPIDSINTNYNDSIVLIDLNVTHSRSIVDLSFETTLSSDKGWWGIRDVKITMLLCDKSCLACTNACKFFVL